WLLLRQPVVFRETISADLYRGGAGARPRLARCGRRLAPARSLNAPVDQSAFGLSCSVLTFFGPPVCGVLFTAPGSVVVFPAGGQPQEQSKTTQARAANNCRISASPLGLAGLASDPA